MNANELADLLEHGAYPTGTREQAATMLRQLQAENEALKATIQAFRAGRGSKSTLYMAQFDAEYWQDKAKKYESDAEYWRGKADGNNNNP